ncbi:serine hydrolase domain-containing protein [Solirubrum puertoriconensis]|uniref:Beta-lactamase-related domain-containing protein n=1 Tax=Solirubrum puertoriconensis TaxID=1751427 RepID=A0A9X0L5T8_SOLP1|nr:serine hydrolase [Solirubrum puertoriconensis]KUG09098.1 hypothetical protein ASU33_19965 [Solirubrum puertoriconensis]
MKITLLLLGLSAITGVARAQTNSAPVPPLAEYTGTYEYRPEYGTLQLLPKNNQLLAIIDEAKYPLRWIRRDVFLNALGDTIPFRRDEAGELTGFVEGSTFYRRLRKTTALPVAALYARRQADGRPVRYRYQTPAAVGDGLPTGTLASVNLPPAPLQRMVQGIIDEQYPGVHSVLLWYRGRLVLEEYFYGYDRQTLQQLRSASKSFVSALVGAAIQQGHIPSDTARVLPFFRYPTYAHPDIRKQAWTFRDFLTMRTGLDCNDDDARSAGNEEKMYPQADWVKFILDLPLTSSPGQQGSYCSGAVAVLGKAVENATRQPLPAFAEAQLFRPLGIDSYKWNYRLDNSNPTVAQLYLAPRDLLKFGVLYLQGGRWANQQVLPAQWVEKSLAQYSRLGSKAYGYLWWHQRFQLAGKAVDTYLATGNGGQKVFIIPGLDAVAVFTGGNYNSTRDTPPNELMPRFILPALLESRASATNPK